MQDVYICAPINLLLPPLKIGHTRPAPQCSDEQHTFALARMLPLTRKLQYLVRDARDADAPNESLALMLRAILADIADEQCAWRQEGWSRGFPRSRLEQRDCLTALRTLAAGLDVNALLKSPRGARAAVWLLARVQVSKGTAPMDASHTQTSGGAGNARRRPFSRRLPLVLAPPPHRLSRLLSHNSARAAPPACPGAVRLSDGGAHSLPPPHTTGTVGCPTQPPC